MPRLLGDHSLESPGSHNGYFSCFECSKRSRSIPSHELLAPILDIFSNNEFTPLPLVVFSPFVSCLIPYTSRPHERNLLPLLSMFLMFARFLVPFRYLLRQLIRSNTHCIIVGRVFLRRRIIGKWVLILVSIQELSCVCKQERSRRRSIRIIVTAHLKEPLTVIQSPTKVLARKYSVEIITAISSAPDLFLFNEGFLVNA